MVRNILKMYAYFKTYKGSTLPFPSCAPNTHPACPYDFIAMFILSRSHTFTIYLAAYYYIDVKVFFRHVFCKVNRLLCKYAIQIHNYSTGKCSMSFLHRHWWDYFFVFSSSAESIVRLKQSGTHHIKEVASGQRHERISNSTSSEHSKFHDKPDLFVKHRYILKE